MAYYNVGSIVNECSGADNVEDTEIVDDLSIVPLDTNSFVICEYCGCVGRRDQFCMRNNNFCTQLCLTRSIRRKHRYNWKFTMNESTEHMAGLIPLEPLPQLQQWQATFNDLQAGPIKASAAVVANSYEWKDELFGCDFLAAPVSLFKHAPLHEMWDTTFEGMKVEVKNTDCENHTEKLGDYFWVASVLKVKGYMGLLRYEGFGSDDSKDFWVNLCCSEVHPVGWCATRGKPLIPPKTIEDKYTDWKKFLVKQLTGARTLPANFYTKLNDSLASRFSIGSIMEVVDKNRISQVKVASVCEIVGKRLHVKYYDSSPEDNGFWCHEDSPLIHYVGWAFRVGHSLDAPQNYCQRVAAGRLTPNDTTPDMFYKYPSNEPPVFTEGSKLEAIDPLNLSSVCAATVMKILQEGYMMIRIESYPPDAASADWFCYHQRSPSIFPVGFALANNISLVPPHGFKPEEFNWETYLTVTGSCAANRSCFVARGHIVSHGFVAGMRLECADLMDPRLVCVATIARVVADMLKVHFDGWGAEYDQWLWAHSTDMYPVGWCRAVGHRLEGPLQPVPRVPRKLPVKPPKRKRRQVSAKVMSQPPNTQEDSSQNSDMMGDKSISPPTSVSEISGDTETVSRSEEPVGMDVDQHPNGHELGEKLMDVKREAISAKTRMSRHSNHQDMPVHNENGNDDEQMDHEDTLSEMSQFTPEISNFMSGITEFSEEPVRFPESAKEFKDNTQVTSDGKHFGETDSQFEEVESKLPETNTGLTEISSDITGMTSECPEASSDFPEATSEFQKAIAEFSEPIPDLPEPDDKVIPRLINTTLPLDVLNTLEPENWTTADVAKFLTVNDCQPYCVNFANITGPKMLQLTKDEIIELLEMKVGPSLKIFDLIQQLKCKIKQPQGRLLSSFK